MRTKSLFNKKIICFHCGTGFKIKKEGKVNRYICSRYDNFGKCKRRAVEEEYLVFLIGKRLEKEVTRKVVDKYVENIIVKDSKLVEIFIKEQDSILMSETFLRY